MERVRYDAIIVGAGPAGVTAAAAIARSGASVLLLEAGAYAGAENWSGCVYFAENLADPEAFGPEAVAAAPHERRVVRRGLLATDGDTLLGLSHTGADTFAHCYTVLRPAFDPHWAALARRLGATVLSGVTATSLIRRGGRVVGVHTSRGPAYADVTFLAEGDASHLVRYEGLERVQAPDFMQGVKAVYRLDAAEIEGRFGLAPGEGAADEYLVRNAQAGGRNVRLNLAAFLYTNRDSLSLGYVVPLKNLAQGYRGPHEALLGYVAGLPGIAEAIQGATLSAFGTKLIRTGGITQSPILVEDGLAVGGAATGLGIDVPYPNFTGPASATGLCFARAVRDLAATGRAPTARNLTTAYLERLRRTRYWQDAQHLSAWPAYMEETDVLFGTAVDLGCGAARYLTAPGSPWGRWWRLGRFLRDHVAPARLGRLVRDGRRFLAASGLGPAAAGAISLKAVGRWAANSLTPGGGVPDDLTVTLRVAGEERGLAALPPGIRGPVRRLLRPLARAQAAVYRNDATPMAERMQAAGEAVATGLRLTDLVLLAGAACGAVAGAVASALTDLFRYKVMRVPAAKLLEDEVGRDNARVRAARELEAVRAVPMAERLATNTYREEPASHIRVLWPEGLSAHATLAEAPYWSVCPAGVYAFEPALSGHGVVTVNHENCIKCESCWQADEGRVRWGRHTEHGLIYRPETRALDETAPLPDAPPHAPAFAPVAALPEALVTAPAHADTVAALAAREARARSALGAFFVAVENVPAAADATRTDWPLRVGEAAAHRLRALGGELLGSEASVLPLLSGMAASPFSALADALSAEVERFQGHLRAGSLFEAVAAGHRIRDTVLDEVAAAVRAAPEPPAPPASSPDPLAPGALEASLRAAFPDRRVKDWDRDGIDAGGAEDLAGRFAALPLPTAEDRTPAATMAALRAWSALHPALGLLGLAHVTARALAGSPHGAAVDGAGLAVEPVDGGGCRIQGRIPLVPARLADHLVVVRKGFAHTIPLDGPGSTGAGVTRRRVPATGLHPAGFETIDFDLTVPPEGVAPIPDWHGTFTAYGYAAIALGAGDYLGRRVVEQAEGRSQFPGQMRDTAGRDGIAKFGAVKTLTARTLAWRALLERLVAVPGHGTLCAATAAMAFSPVNGRMGYDAGQTFGGTGYSEDDLLARFYRDSAVFPHLAPGREAARALAARWRGGDSPLPLAARLASDPSGLAALADGPLGPTVQRWQTLAARVDRLEMTSVAAGEALTLALGTFHLLTEARDALEAGLPAEGRATGLDLLLDEALDLVGRAEAEQAEKPPFATGHFPEMPDVPEMALETGYDALVALDDPYASGDFLKGPGTGAPRFVPEVQLHDPTLRERWSTCYDWFRERCTDAPDGSGPYERYVEAVHAIPPEILDGYVQERFLATVVPQELDGLGWRKIDYYLLVSGAMRFGDASLSLLIMASTSIGTTPALISLEKEIPLVAKELGDFVAEPERLAAIRKGLDGIVASLAHPDPARLERDFTRLLEQVEATIRRTKVTKYLAQNFLKAFYEAALAGRRRDFPAFDAGLKEAREHLEKLPDALRLALDELPRRERAAQAFLRALGHGAVSAFALTEPTAGSDSGGVATTAHLRSVPLTALADGRYRFEVDGRERFLLDADRIVYTDDGMAYDVDGEPAPVSTSGYDYATDRGVRTVRLGGAELPFHDVAQVRGNDREGHRYDFYELSGAKMWITNGRVAHQFAMYVKTDEGITGLMVDRHAEGLIVGRDEDKMGQKGSPTNELAIDRVRVPRECVIGYEGHGQVNALETLNVGRCGLAVAGVVMARRLLAEARAALPEGEAADRVLAEAAARVFSTESLCYHLIGRFDNHHTRSVRMESAVAKYVSSEMFHECLDRIEPLLGPVAQTQDLLVEKMRRDARILNIYEGTNEVQRFLILRELCGMAPEWGPVPQPQEDGPAADLARGKETLRRAVLEAVDQLGDAVWQDAAMQPAFFPLAEMAGELYLLDCTLYRIDWIEQRREDLGADYADPLLAVGRRAARQCLERLEVFYARYQRGRKAALNSRYPAAAVAADTAMEDARAALPPAPSLAADAQICCLVRPVAVPAPAPRLGADGRLKEVVWRIHPGDEHALARALAIRAGAMGTVTVRVVGCGGAHGEALLRDALAAGADAAHLLDLPPEADPAAWAEALTGLPDLAASDLLVCGDGGAPLAPFLAARLELALATGADLTVAPDGAALRLDNGEALSGRTVAALSDTTARLAPTILGHARTAATPVTRVAGAPCAGEVRFARPAAGGGETERATDVAAVAALVQAHAEAARGLAAEPFSGDWEPAPLPKGAAVWTVAEPHDPKGAVAAFAAARQLADRLDVPARALLVGDEDGIRALAGRARQAGIAQAHGLDTGGVALSASGRVKVMGAVARAKGAGRIPERVVAPAGWEHALAHVAGERPGHPAVWGGVTGLEGEDGAVTLTVPAYDGRLNALVNVPADTPLWLATAPTAAFPGEPVEDFTLARSSLRLARTVDLDPDFTPPKDDLTTAEVIVDVGLGAGSPEGMALAERLMEALRALGLTPHLGATRKITQGLGLLGTDHQIGQTGVKVNPKLVFALGISGAPQHVDYLGSRADVIAFNKDAEAPLMTLQRSGLTVHPVVGDLFETVEGLVGGGGLAGLAGPLPWSTSTSPSIDRITT
jgi:electron transfer flavoprotein-quinone oxidoreductase